MTVEQAENMAIQALSHLAADEERLSRFFDATGLSPLTVRAAASSPDFYAAVLDYIASDEPLLIDFARVLRQGPERIMEAKTALSSRDHEV